VNGGRFGGRRTPPDTSTLLARNADVRPSYRPLEVRSAPLDCIDVVDAPDVFADGVLHGPERQSEQVKIVVAAMLIRSDGAAALDIHPDDGLNSI
jgi:hypothetical protein